VLHVKPPPARPLSAYVHGTCLYSWTIMCCLLTIDRRTSGFHITSGRSTANCTLVRCIGSMIGHVKSCMMRAASGLDLARAAPKSQCCLSDSTLARVTVSVDAHVDVGNHSVDLRRVSDSHWVETATRGSRQRVDPWQATGSLSHPHGPRHDVAVNGAHLGRKK
jgi:hypothetical protein